MKTAILLGLLCIVFLTFAALAETSDESPEASHGWYGMEGMPQEIAEKEGYIQPPAPDDQPSRKPRWYGMEGMPREIAEREGYVQEEQPEQWQPTDYYQNTRKRWYGNVLIEDSDDDEANDQYEDPYSKTLRTQSYEEPENSDETATTFHYALTLSYWELDHKQGGQAYGFRTESFEFEKGRARKSGGGTWRYELYGTNGQVFDSGSVAIPNVYYYDNVVDGQWTGGQRAAPEGTATIEIDYHPNAGKLVVYDETGADRFVCPDVNERFHIKDL